MTVNVVPSPWLLSDYQVPHGATSKRLTWSDLGTAGQQLIQDQIGAQVTAVHPCGGGFTPGFAAILDCADGQRIFVKAGHREFTPFAYQSYRAEAAALADVQPLLTAHQVAAAPLLWHIDDGHWSALGFAAITGTHPTRPWRPAQVIPCLAALATLAKVPAPSTGVFTETADFTAASKEFWAHWRADAEPNPHDADIDHLLNFLPAAMTTDSLIHHDVRDDNLIIDASDPTKVYLCDWNFASCGPKWFDSLCLLIGVHGDGLDVSAYLAASAVFIGVPSDHIDAVLAGLLGYFLAQQSKEQISDSPHLRGHQRWYANATGSLLATRRGW